MIVKDYKLFENLQKSKKILKDLNIPETNETYLKLREMLKNNNGYLGKFTKWLFIDHESFEQLEEMYKDLLKFQLDKPIDSFDKLENLYDYIQSKTIGSKTNQVINALPSRTRQLVNKELTDLISLNVDSADLIRDFYSKKGGRFKTINDLLKETKTLIENSKGDYNLDSIKKSLDGLNVNIVYETPELLIVTVGDYESSCKIGSRHWCIATSKNMWDNYVDGTTKQYFIWDFTKSISDKKHMIGATIGLNNKVKTAHWADDTRVDNPDQIFDEL